MFIVTTFLWDCALSTIVCPISVNLFLRLCKLNANVAKSYFNVGALLSIASPRSVIFGYHRARPRLLPQASPRSVIFTDAIGHALDPLGLDLGLASKSNF